MSFYDIDMDASGLRQKLETARRLGWSGVCVLVEEKDLAAAKKDIESLGAGMEVFLGALLNPSNASELQKKAKKALDMADLVYVLGGDEANRAAAESWEVDVLCSPERDSGRDLMKQKASGLDAVMARYMSERKIAVEFNIADLLASYGMVRSQIMGKMRQNIVLARKYSVPMIISSGAKDWMDLRAPRDMMAIGERLGMTRSEAKDAISENPARLLEKSGKRKDPNIILEGLEVLSWGSQERKEKKTHGFY